MSSRSQRRRSRRPATIEHRERDRLLSYLPAEEAPVTVKEEPGNESGTARRAAPQHQVRHITRDYSYVPPELIRVAVLTIGLVIVLIVLALAIR